MSELKPCPFCGERVELRRDMQGFNIIECDSCKTSTYIFRKKTADIVEAWNTRAVAEPPHGDWHTGTPTEECWYLQCIKSKNNITYDTDYYENGDWKYPCIFREIVAWQKIEQYRG